MTFMPEEQDIDTNVEQDDTTEGSQEVSVDTLTAQKRIALEQRNAAREEAKKLQNRIQELEKLVPSKTPEPTKVEPTNYLTKDDVEPLKFALAHKDLGEKELEKLTILKKAYGSLEEAYKSEEFQAYAEKTAATQKASEFMPSGNRSGHQEDEEIPNPVKDREAYKKWVMDGVK